MQGGLKEIAIPSTQTAFNFATNQVVLIGQSVVCLVNPKQTKHYKRAKDQLKTTKILFFQLSILNKKKYLEDYKKCG